MKKFMLFLFIALCFNVNAISSEWNQVNSANISGRVNSILINPNNQSQIAATYNGGIWKSNDSGLNWNRCNANLPSMLTSCMFKTANGTIYIGTGYSDGLSIFTGAGIYKTNDWGNTFELLSSTIPQNNLSDFSSIIDIAVHPIDTNRIYVATPNKFLVSEDGGNTWRNDYIAINGIYKVYGVKVADDGSVYVLINNQLYVSNTGNLGSFMPKLTININVNLLSSFRLAVNEKFPNIIYVAYANSSSNNGVYFSSDKGNSFTFLGSNNIIFGNDKQWYCHTLKVNPNNPLHIFWACNEIWEWKITNPNNNIGLWNKLSVSYPNNASNYVPEFTFDIAFYNISGVYYAATSNGICYSSNFGSKWRNYSNNLNVSEGYDLDIGGNGNLVATADKNGALFYKPFSIVDYNQTDIVKYGGLILSSSCKISSIKPSFIFLSSLYNHLILASNTNDSSYYYLNLTGQVPHINSSASLYANILLWESKNNLLSKDSLWFVNNSSTIYEIGDTINIESKHKGVYFKYLLYQNLLPGDSVFVQDRVTSRLFYAHKNSIWMANKPFNSSSNKNVWIKLIQFNSNVTVADMDITSDGNFLWIALENGLVYKIENIQELSDNDKTLNYNDAPPFVLNHYQYNLGGKISSITINQSNSDELIITLKESPVNNNTKIIYTANANSIIPVFEYKQSNLPDLPVYSAIFNKNYNGMVIIGTEKGIWYTNNILSNNPIWIKDNDFPNTSVLKLKQQQRNNNWPEVQNGGLIFARTWGMGVWYSKKWLDIDTKILNQNVLNQNHILLYPNPVNAMGKLNIELANNIDKAEVKFYNIDGKQVKNIPLSNLRAGNNTVDYTVNELPMGTYFVRFEGANVVKTTKLVVVK